MVADIEEPGTGGCAVDPSEGTEGLGNEEGDGCRVIGGSDAARLENCQPIQPAPSTPSAMATSSGNDDLRRRRWTGTYPSVASTASPCVVRGDFARAGVSRPRRSESKS